jgi:hypothetical protein
LSQVPVLVDTGEPFVWHVLGENCAGEWNAICASNLVPEANSCKSRNRTTVFSADSTSPVSAFTRSQPEDVTERL